MELILVLLEHQVLLEVLEQLVHLEVLEQVEVGEHLV
jgi:hypothetical protein